VRYVSNLLFSKKTECVQIPSGMFDKGKKEAFSFNKKVGTNQDRNHGNHLILCSNDHGSSAVACMLEWVLEERSSYTNTAQIESGRALGAGAKHGDPLDLVPLICVGVASKCSWLIANIASSAETLQYFPSFA
jgi:hypothetical protein